MKISLNTFPISGKTAITLFLILLWYGYLLAALNTRLSVGLSAESIADHYSDHSLTKSETQDIEQKGFSEEEVVIDSSEQKQEARSKKQDVTNKNSKAPSPGLSPTRGEDAKPPSPLTGEGQGGGELRISLGEHNHHADHEPDDKKGGNGTITPQQIIQLGHIHLLGFSLLFVSLGIILSLTGIRELFKVVILFILFLSFGLDIGGLLLVRFVSPGLAIITVISGIGTGICMAVISLAAMYDMWVRRSTVMDRS
ncbi:MAG: hypothetical protein HZA08_04030 [Nitrospirae bacterium]|nr:hypothetical protein [Nitrospirota bacterium]